MRQIKIGKVLLTDGGEWNASTGYAVLTYVRHNGDGWWSCKANINSEPSSSNTNWVQATNVQSYITEMKEAISTAESDHSTASSDHTRAVADHATSVTDHNNVQSDVTAAKTAANSASSSASAAATSAANTETYMTELKAAIAALPDGQAVSEEVAEHTVKLNELDEKVGNLSIADGCLCVTYNND